MSAINQEQSGLSEISDSVYQQSQLGEMHRDYSKNLKRIQDLAETNSKCSEVVNTIFTSIGESLQACKTFEEWHAKHWDFKQVYAGLEEEQSQQLQEEVEEFLEQTQCSESFPFPDTTRIYAYKLFDPEYMQKLRTEGYTIKDHLVTESLVREQLGMGSHIEELPEDIAWEFVTMTLPQSSVDSLHGSFLSTLKEAVIEQATVFQKTVPLTDEEQKNQGQLKRKRDLESSAEGRIPQEMMNRRRQEKTAALLLVSEHPEQLVELPDAVRFDRDVMDAAIAKNAEVIQCITDKDYVINLLQANGMLLRFVHDSLKQDLQVLQAAISNNVHAFEFVPDQFRDIPQAAEAATELIWGALYKDPMMMKFMGPNVCDDDELLSDLVEINGMVLQYASDRIKDNEKIVRAAINNNSDAEDFVSSRLSTLFF